MANMLNSISYQDLYDELEKVRGWLNSKRIKTTNTRFEEILKYVKEINDHFKGNTLETIINQHGTERLEFPRNSGHTERIG